VLSQQPLRRRPVTRIPRTARRLLVARIANVIGDLDLQRSFHQPLGQLCQGSREFPRCDHGNSSPCGVAGERRAERVEGVAVAAHAVAVAGHGEDAGVVE
jgi:hypothetical protein